MKKKGLGPKAGKILLAFGCLLLAFVFWFVIKYSETTGMPVSFFGLG